MVKYLCTIGVLHRGGTIPQNQELRIPILLLVHEMRNCEWENDSFSIPFRFLLKGILFKRNPLTPILVPIPSSKMSQKLALFLLQRTWRSSQLLDFESLPNILSRMPRTRTPADFLRVTAPPPIDMRPRREGFCRLNCNGRNQTMTPMA